MKMDYQDLIRRLMSTECTKEFIDSIFSGDGNGVLSGVEDNLLKERVLSGSASSEEIRRYITRQVLRMKMQPASTHCMCTISKAKEMNGTPQIVISGKSLSNIGLVPGGRFFIARKGRHLCIIPIDPDTSKVRFLTVNKDLSVGDAAVDENGNVVNEDTEDLV